MLDALCATADVVVDSFRPSTARRLGVDAATLHARHPRLVCASISGFGQTGPYAERAAHDINYQALAGLLRPPQLPGPLVGDIGAAMQAAVAHPGGAAPARRGPAPAASSTSRSTTRRWRGRCFPTTGELANACYNIYETADGQWLALGALEPKFWTGVLRADRPAGSRAAAARAGRGARARAARGARGDARPHARRMARRVCRRRCVPDADLHARRGRRRSARRRARRRRHDRRRRRSAPIPTPCWKRRASTPRRAHACATTGVI